VSIPIREMVLESVKSLGNTATHSQIIEYVKTKYGDINEGTIRAQITSCSVNQISRIHYTENKKSRKFDERYDVFYSPERGKVELYDPKKHGNWEITIHEGQPKITHNGKIISNSDVDEFFFVEKDFESLTRKKEDAQYLHDRFKDLLNILKNKLDESFREGEKYVNHPFNQGSKEWRDYHWLGFARKGTWHQNKYDSIQFQVALTKKNNLSTMIWLDGNASVTRINVLNQIKKNKERFVQILKSIPSSYYIRIQNNRSKNIEEIQLSDLNSEFIDKIEDRLSQKESELEIGRRFTKDEAIQYETEIVDKILDSFENLITMSDFLGISKTSMAAIKAHSCFILSQYSDSKYENIEGEQYQYDNNKPNSRKLLQDSKFIIQSKINNENYFVGYGKIGKIDESEDINEKGKTITKFVAKFSEYHKFDSPKLRTNELYDEMKSMQAYGSQPPSILPITRKLFAKITGENIDDDLIGKVGVIPQFAEILLKRKQLIFYGPPGTGKTFNAVLLADHLIKDNSRSSQKMTFRSAAIHVLKEAGKPMHYTEIAKKILTDELVQTSGETPEFTILKEMSKDIQINNKNSIFEKTDRGFYQLNPNLEEIEIKTTEKILDEKPPFVRSVTFHQSYSYEDFIEGIRPHTVNNQISYELEDGIFKIISKDAKADPQNKYVLLIDEINRGNISKIFGELITLIEKDKREVHKLQLGYSKEDFTVPSNLFIIGTMNTADRSLVQIDTALRRRFAFCELMPQTELLNQTIEEISLKQLLIALNQRINKQGLREKQIGHSYLINVNTLEDLHFVFTHEIVPLLQDYFFDDYKKLETDILSSDFIDSENMIIKKEWQEDPHLFLEILKKTFQL